MTIFLPEEPTAFRNAFDNACDRIINSKQDLVFFSFYAALIDALRTHSLVGAYFLDFETTAEKMNREFKAAVFEVMKEEWMLLWKMHPHSWRIRIELAKIKCMVTQPRSIGFSSLFRQLNFAFLCLRVHPRCCHIDEKLVSSKRMELVAKTSISGNNIFEKRRTIQAIAAIDPFFCWGRMKFFLDCWHFNETASFPKSLNRSREEIGQTAWDSMWEACDKMVLLGAKMDFRNRLASPSHEPSPFVSVEHLIIRKDYEELLYSLKQHIWNHFSQLEQTVDKQTKEKEAEENDFPLELPGTLKEDFIVYHAKQFWKKNPLGKRDDAFKYYLEHCHSSKLLKRDRWNQIIRERKLDPRPKEAKKRGNGKKTCKK